MTQLSQWHRDTAAALAASICPPADKSAPMRKFLVLIGQRDDPRLKFEAMARSSFDAVQQHDSLREPGERIEVEPILSAAEQWHEANDRRALLSQVAAQDRAEGMQRG